MQFKSYVLSNILVRKIKQKGVNIAIACGATLLLCNVSYAKTQDLGAGGTDNWTATCSGWFCNLGGSATHDILNIKNGDGSGSYNFGAIRMQTNNFGGSVRLDIVSDKPNSGMITIDDLHTWSTGTFVAINTLNVNADTYIKSLRYLI